MTIEKRANGKYRITQMIDGKRYRVTLDHKPTKREAEDAIRELVADSATYADKDMTFQKAAEGYIRLKHEVLSPSTRRGYHIIIRRLSDGFKGTMINDMDHIIVQNEISRLSGSLAPKTVCNTHAFIKSVLEVYRPGIRIRTTLPPKKNSEGYLPTEEEVRRILDYVKGTKYYVPFILGVCGMRRSEICAVTGDDIKDNTLHICKARVDGDEGLTVKDSAKTTDSTRTIYLQKEIADTIAAQGYAFKHRPDNLRRRLHEVQDALNIPRFRFHDLRVYFVSYAHTVLNIPEKLIQEAGGWKSDYTMKKVYRRTMQEEYKNSQEKFLSSLEHMGESPRH